MQYKKVLQPNAPKFTNFSGVTLRDHTYTFNLNPYNQHDAHEITKIIETFKLMALPGLQCKP